jgi:hypothetical protein
MFIAYCFWCELQGGSMSNTKRGHASKLLQKMSKRASAPVEKNENSSSEQSGPSLRAQYEIIRNDVIKLRDDLTKGYDMAKTMVEKKGFITQFLKVR